MSKNSFLNTLTMIALGIFTSVIMRACVILVGYIPSTSMENTLHKEDFIIANKLAYIFNSPKRGDIVCFTIEALENEIYIKRIIGIPGDHIEIHGNTIIINDKIYNEDYLKDDNWGNNEIYIYDVPDGCYFLLGDNRNDSYDSRYWDNPYITKKNIIAKFGFIIKKGNTE